MFWCKDFGLSKHDSVFVGVKQIKEFTAPQQKLWEGTTHSFTSALIPGVIMNHI